MQNPPAPSQTSPKSGLRKALDRLRRGAAAFLSFAVVGGTAAASSAQANGAPATGGSKRVLRSAELNPTGFRKASDHDNSGITPTENACISARLNPPPVRKPSANIAAYVAPLNGTAQITVRTETLNKNSNPPLVGKPVVTPLMRSFGFRSRNATGGVGLGGTQLENPRKPFPKEITNVMVSVSIRQHVEGTRRRKPHYEKKPTNVSFELSVSSDHGSVKEANFVGPLKVVDPLRTYNYLAFGSSGSRFSGGAGCTR